MELFVGQVTQDVVVEDVVAEDVVAEDVVAEDVNNSDIDQPGSVAIVHDYLTQRGGAERVVLAMHRAFPTAPIYTSLYEPDLTFPEFRDIDVRPTYLNRSQFLRRHHRLALPLLPHAFSTLEIDAKVVLCSSSGFAHGIHTEGTKLVYCYSPARWLYKRADYFRKIQDGGNGKAGSTPPLHGIHTSFVFRNALLAITPILRRWDRGAAATASEYYTTSSAVSDEISTVYGIHPLIISPPPFSAVDGPSEKPRTVAKDGFFLVVSRPRLQESRSNFRVCSRNALTLSWLSSGPDPSRRPCITWQRPTSSS